MLMPDSESSGGGGRVAGAFNFTGMVNVLPDNKIVEDCHNGMKADAKKLGGAAKGRT